MARIHAHTRGKSHSTRPASPTSPSWLTKTPAEVSSLVVSLSKEGLSPSMIGLNLRDLHAIPLVKPVTGKTITQVLAENDIKKDMPEDLRTPGTKSDRASKTSEKPQHRPQKCALIGAYRSKDPQAFESTINEPENFLKTGNIPP